MPSLRPSPGPSATASARSAADDHGVGGARQQAAGRVLGQRPLDRLEQPRLDHGQRRLRSGDRDVAGVGAERRERGEHRRAGEPARAAHDEHAARAVLRAGARLPRHLGEHGRRHEGVLVRRRREPDRRHLHGARVEAAGRDREPDLRGAKGDGDRGANGRARHLAAGGVHAGGHVDRDDRLSARVDALDHPRRVLAWRLAEADPEQSVHDHVRPARLVRVTQLAESLDHRHVTAGVLQDARADAAVAAVQAAAANDGNAAGEAREHDLRDGAARPLHQLLQRPLVRLLGAPRLVRGDERL